VNPEFIQPGLRNPLWPFPELPKLVFVLPKLTLRALKFPEAKNLELPTSQ
jgi:hypothetical protein